MASRRKETEKEAKSPFSSLRDLRDKLAKEADEAEKNKKAGASKPRPAPAPNTSGARSTGSGSGAGTGDDLDFHRLMSGVTPLDDRDRGRRVPKVDAPKPARTARANEPDTTMEHLRVLIDEGSKFEVLDDGRRVEGHRVDVPPELVRRLRRGGFPVDGMLDLHGRSASESREALETFLREKRQRGERCVLVVHGKGAHSPGGISILRGEMSAWLSQGPASVHVGAFATALDNDGGEGAVYVLLRR